MSDPNELTASGLVTHMVPMQHRTDPLADLLYTFEVQFAGVDPVIRHALIPPSIMRHPDETDAEYKVRVMEYHHRKFPTTPPSQRS